MTPEQNRLARHALGLPNDRRRSYRNRFHASAAHTAYQDWCEMVEKGWADFERDDPDKSDRMVFWLRPEGARLALQDGETLDPEDFPPSAEGFTDELRERCRDRCAFYGDPPCWRLPEIAGDQLDEPIRPCEQCLTNAPNPDA